MARVVKLQELLPEDVVFELPGGQRVTFPGDPPLELILKIAALFERAQGDDGSEASEIGMDVLQQLDDELVRLIRMRDPEANSSPFGVLGVQHVVAQLLAAYNFGVEEEAGEDDADPPPPAARSTRSSGSRSSSKRSGSTRRTGTR